MYAIRSYYVEKLKIYSFGLFDKKEKMNVYTSSELTSHGGKNEGLSSIFQSESRPSYNFV